MRQKTHFYVYSTYLDLFLFNVNPIRNLYLYCKTVKKNLNSLTLQV